MTNGFTIIEALCAFAILALVMVALYAVGGTSTRILAVGMTNERAALLAQSKLDELASDSRALPQFENGEFEGTDTKWQMAALAAPAREGSPIRLQTAVLTLTWPDPRGAGSLTVETRHMGAVAP